MSSIVRPAQLARGVAAAALVAMSLASLAHAQVAPAASRISTSTTYSYADGPRTRTLEVDADGSMWLLSSGRRFPTALGTDRVIVVGRDLDGLDVVIDEVLSERSGIVAVRSRREGEGALALPSRLATAVRTGRIESASPDIALAHVARDITVPPNDPSLGGQWFYETIDMPTAWAREDGDPSVTIAVVDNGCDTTHPDLAAHMLAGYDALDDDDDPSYLPSSAGNEHGTACAGLAAAVTDNGVDVAGTCPECSLRCVRLLGAPGTLIPISTDVRAFEWILAQTDVAVVSNSWGFEAGAGAPFALVRAIATVITEGHGGRGALVVFAAGNDAAVIGADEIQAIPGVLNVGAINTFDEAAAFSNSGQSVALVAPTGTLTTDVSGPDGAEPGDITRSFGGTSSACPIVAGVGGLLASARPDLSGPELRAALVESVRRAPFAVPDELGHDPLYGYGIVDPGAALARVLGEDEDAGVPDAGTPQLDAGSSPPPSGGCACRVTDGGGRPGLASLVGIVLLLARRVRSRARRGKHGSRRHPSLGAALMSLGLVSLMLAGCAEGPSEVRPTVAELRPNTPGSMELPPRYDTTDVVESLVSPGGAFRIHFTRAGRHAVPAADVDADGTPDHVALIARTYDDVLARYVEMGFRAPLGDEAVPVDNGGDALFDVYLVDFGGGSDGAFRRESCSAAGCTGYMLQENDFAGSSYPSVGYGVRLLASHELFHAVQAAYDDGLGAQGSVLSEGTAVWASERFDPSLSDVEHLAYGYTSRTDRSLGVDPATAGGAYTYGTGIVFEHLGVSYGDEIVRELWEDLAAAPDDSEWLTVPDAPTRASPGSSFEASFLGLAEWMMFLGARADATRGPVNGAAYDPVAAMVVTAPYEDRTVRMFPAAIRYFAVESGTLAVELGGAEASAIDVVAVAFDGTTFATRASGRGGLELDAPSASLTLIALVDGRTSGMSRVVSVCIASSAAECASASDAGGTDAGTVAGDSGAVGADVGATPPPAVGCACRAARRGGTSPEGILIALGFVALAGRRSRMRRRESSQGSAPPGGSQRH